MHLDDRGQLAEVNISLWPWGCQGLNSGHQAWWQGPFTRRATHASNPTTALCLSCKIDKTFDRTYLRREVAFFW